MADTKIEWCDIVWNITRGCRRVSPGCENCYAERQAARFSGPGGAYEGLVKLTKNGPRWSGAGRFVIEKLVEPLSWKKAKRVFVNSMSDLFFDEFTNEQIAAVFGVMMLCPHITFQILTKRPERMREWFAWVSSQLSVTGALIHPQEVCYQNAYAMLAPHGWASDDLAELERRRMRTASAWPLANVWLGTSCENQDAADTRIPELLSTPAAIRFLSCEPLLGAIDLTRIGKWREVDLSALTECVGHVERPRIDWVIVGCESGPRARPCDVEWLRSLRDQCGAARVPFFLKQAETTPGRYNRNLTMMVSAAHNSKTKGARKGKHAAIVTLPNLDGVQHAAFPVAA